MAIWKPSGIIPAYKKKLMPVRQLVLKIASRCNLNCTYCYMYNVGDDTYKKQPKVMSREVVNETLKKVRQHCVTHALAEFDFVFHGGEPLLAGREFFEYFIHSADDILGPGISYSISVQTNGTLINEDWSRFFSENGILAGVSIDGPETVHDSHRKYHSGRGSFQDVINGLRVLQEHNPASVITVVDPYSDPAALYMLLKRWGIERLNTIIPYANYDFPPLQITGYVEQGLTLFADWLIRLFDIWIKDRKPKPSIMLFDQIISLVLGNEDAGNDVLGRTRNELLVIESNGSIEPAGSLKICGNGFTKQGVSILNNGIDDAMTRELVEMYYNSHQHLSPKCSRCMIKDVCGGGLFASRYRSLSGFLTPSVYCLDWMKLITNIQNAVIDLFPHGNIVHEYITRLDYEHLRKDYFSTTVMQ